MTKTFTYCYFSGNNYYLEETDENEEFGGKKINYEVGNRDLEEAVVEIVYRNYFNHFDNKNLKKSIEYFISDLTY